MIVYGDHSRRATPRDVYALCRDLLARDGMRIERHAALVAALIEIGKLAQAVADREHEAAGLDVGGPGERTLMGLAVDLAGAVGRSWDANLAPADARQLLPPGADLPFADDALSLREPEGFAHYALYPESYWQAARGALPASTLAVGLRSIGTTLAATVAAAIGAADPVTVRPVGHPFDRHLRLAPPLEARLHDNSGPVAVVDEGPGLSGSSFGAVGRALGPDGAARAVLFPSHENGPGAEASESNRTFWQDARKRFVAFDALVGEAARPGRCLVGWVADLTGPTLAPLRDIAGGRWRALAGGNEADWPPADAFAESRKFLIEGTRGRFLLKFTGLGRRGLDLYALQLRLAAAGFTTEPSGWRHGFLVEPWRDDWTSLQLAQVSRPALVDHLARYLAFRAAHLPAEGRSGATPEALFEMLCVNAAEALGPETAAGFAHWRQALPALTSQIRPVMTDNRLQSWEWRVARDGRLIKTDAVCHHAGHDLVGCQDIAWDVAGAAIEFGLEPAEVARIETAIADTGAAAPSPDLLAFCRAAYAAYQVGACALAAGRSDSADAQRWQLHAERYRTALRAALPR